MPTESSDIVFDASPSPGESTSGPQPPQPAWTFSRYALVLALVCYSSACLTTGLVFAPRGDGAMPGYALLALGWLGLFVGALAWLANPVFGLSLLFQVLRYRKTALGLAALALCLALDTLTLFGKQLPADEGGVNTMELQSLGPGFYCWIASIVALAVGTLSVPRASE